jgi:hypothetical protein
LKSLRAIHSVFGDLVRRWLRQNFDAAPTAMLKYRARVRVVLEARAETVDLTE